ncbi:MAG TPA: amidohydrolase family protein [Acidobacteriota bacterium]|nr:amidohydrolase family protein [Acidobacteriota bacterium]
MRNQVSGSGPTLLSAIEKMPVVDSHEHLMPVDERSRRAKDFSYLFSQYLGPELVSAGMHPEDLKRFYSPEVSETEKIKLFLPHWRLVSHTSLAAVKQEAARRFFGVERFDEEGLRRLSQAIRESAQPDWYRKVLDGRGIRAMVVNYMKPHHDLGWRRVEDSPLYRYTANFDDFIWIASRGDIEDLESEFSLPLRTLDDLLEALEAAFAARIEERTAALKSVMAYFRTLEVADDPSPAEAGEIFQRLRQRSPRPFDPGLRGQDVQWARPLQDLLMHRICRLASRLELPLQVHVGYQAGNANILSHSDPRLLTPLLLRYPDLDFELLHAGYPYHLSSVALAKMFPNAYLNFSWIFALAPAAAREALSHAVEMVPAAKITAFGGDARLVESLAVHLDWARQAIAEVLDRKMAEGRLSRESALQFARRILFTSPRKLYRLEDLGEETA